MPQEPELVTVLAAAAVWLGDQKVANAVSNNALSIGQVGVCCRGNLEFHEKGCPQIYLGAAQSSCFKQELNPPPQRQEIDNESIRFQLRPSTI